MAYSEKRDGWVSARLPRSAIIWKKETGYLWPDIIQAGIEAISGKSKAYKKQVAFDDLLRAARLTVARLEEYDKTVRRKAIDSRRTA